MESNIKPQDYKNKAAKKRARRREREARRPSQSNEAGVSRDHIRTPQKHTVPTASHGKQLPVVFPSDDTAEPLIQGFKPSIRFGSQEEEGEDSVNVAEVTSEDKIQQQNQAMLIEQAMPKRELSAETKTVNDLPVPEHRFKPEVNEFIPAKRPAQPLLVNANPHTQKDKEKPTRASNTGRKLQRSAPGSGRYTNEANQAATLRSLLDQMSQCFNLMEQLCNNLAITTSAPAPAQHHGLSEDLMKLLRSEDQREAEKPTWLPIADPEGREMRLHLGTRRATYQEPPPGRQKITEKNRARRQKQKQNRSRPRKASDATTSTTSTNV